MPEVVNLAEKLSLITGHWKPRIVGSLNGQEVKLVKCQGEFVWHSHSDVDEMFLCLSGRFRIALRDRTVELGPGEFFIVPRGVEHCPSAEEEACIMLFEPAGVINTGSAADSTLTAIAEAL